MRVVLDTNILISALIQPSGRSAGLVEAWIEGRFAVLFCDELLDEFRRVTRGPKLRTFISPPLAGRLFNDIKSMGIYIPDIPDIDLSPDPWDNYLLALSENGKADFLVTGDKADLLQLHGHRSCRIVAVRDFAAIIGV